MSAQSDPEKEHSKGATTRERLLGAAREVVAQRGWFAATSRAIAQQAQANPALINYYFNSKDQLLEAMVQESLARLSTEFGEGARREKISLPQIMLEAAHSIRAKEFSQDRIVLLEAANQASRDPKLGELALELLNLFRSFLCDVVRNPPQERQEPQDSSDSRAWAAVVAAFLDGLALHAQIDPELDLEGCVRLFEAKLQVGEPVKATL